MNVIKGCWYCFVLTSFSMRRIQFTPMCYVSMYRILPSMCMGRLDFAHVRVLVDNNFVRLEMGENSFVFGYILLICFTFINRSKIIFAVWFDGRTFYVTRDYKFVDILRSIGWGKHNEKIAECIFLTHYEISTLSSSKINRLMS